MAFLLDGKPLAVDVAFSHNDINYPANWLRLSSPQEKKDLGITEVEEEIDKILQGNQIGRVVIKHGE